MKIRKIGTDEIYTDAIDVLDYYEETDISLDTQPPTEDEMREARHTGADMNINIIEQARKSVPT